MLSLTYSTSKNYGGETLRNLFFVDVISLRKLMIDKGINTIKELSDKSDVDRNTLSKILKGETAPSAVAMDGIAEALEMDSKTVGEIFFATNLRNKKEKEMTV